MRAIDIAETGDEAVCGPRKNLRRAAAHASRLVSLTAVALAALLAPAPAAHAQDAAALVTPGDVKSGALLLKSNQEGRYVEAPRLGTDIEIAVSGPTVRARITQIFHNPTEGWVEAVYVYPMSEGGAVDTLKMVIGDRIVIGEIKERREAKRIYERAKAEGRKATLLEQERPNLFTNSVANIGPGESVLVQIEYQEPVRQSGDVFSLRVPLVVGPRYNPKPVVQTVDFDPQGRGWAQVADPVPDRDRIEPPVRDPAVHDPVNPVSIFVRLQAGFRLGAVESHHHAVRVEESQDDARLIRLAGNAVPADRDFELTWRPATSEAPAVGLFRERVGEADYLVAFVTPPALAQAEEARPREIVFVIDNSGSMGGTSIAQAKASLVYALDRLRPTDRFNVIRFDDSMDVLFPDTVAGAAVHVARAKGFVLALEARGGTEMLPPLQAALADPRPDDAGTLRQVVFLTDGAIGNEQQLFDTLTAMRGRSRVFMVGIGSAPNSFLMTRAAELGRGTFTHIGSAAQVDTRMRALFEKLESPAVTNLSAAVSGARADVTPGTLPDLYRGEPLVIAAKLGDLAGTLEVKGTVGDRPWVVRLPLAQAAEGRGLSKLWARRRIADAEVLRTLRRLAPEEADRTILALALEHHLVTRLTSLVAVDRTPSRPEGARLTRADLPLNLPAGWEFDKVFGRERAPLPGPDATETRRTEALDAIRVASATQVAAKPRPIARAQGAVQLPKTATDAELRLWLGLALMLASLALLAWRRRARAA
ncbi:MAG: marine proteobacterial sortase target protein [Xanthobacteraceae bacterium]|nr:marine proteobacterial sortase target protein [Xanthobacteraceae bacterium]